MNGNDYIDPNDIPGGISEEADLRFFAIALVSATNQPPRSADDPPFTEEDIWNLYDIETLAEIQKNVIRTFVDSGYEAAKLGTKWGTDDDLVTAPEPVGPVLKTTEIYAKPLTKNSPVIWTIYRYTNLVQIFPHGPGASGAGPHEIWVTPLPIPAGTPPGVLTFVH